MICVLFLPSTNLKDKHSEGQCNGQRVGPWKGNSTRNRTCRTIPSYTLQEPSAMSRNKSNKLCKIKKLGLFKATDILICLHEGRAPHKVSDIPKSCHRYDKRAGQADRVPPVVVGPPCPLGYQQPDTTQLPLGISSLLWIPSASVQLAPSHTEDRSDFLVNSCKTLEPWARTSEGTAIQEMG